MLLFSFYAYRGLDARAIEAIYGTFFHMHITFRLLMTCTIEPCRRIIVIDYQCVRKLITSLLAVEKIVLTYNVMQELKIIYNYFLTTYNCWNENMN
jgi:hypothetical protein